MIEPWVSVDDAARHLGVVKESIYRWIDAKGLPARKVGKLWKLKLSELDAWVRAGGAAEGGRAESSEEAPRGETTGNPARVGETTGKSARAGEATGKPARVARRSGR